MSAALAREEAVSVWQLRWRRLRQDGPALAGAGTLVLLMALSFSAPLFEAWRGVSGVTTDLLGRFDPPSELHWLGADDAGRDELARLMRGGQVSLTIGLMGALGASLLGTIIGAAAGYFRGRTDMILMRITDFMISLPALPILIILAALDLTKLGFSQEFIRSGSAG